MSVASSVMKIRLNDVSHPASLSYRLRAKRDVRLRSLILDIAHQRPGPVRILDLGGSVDYWRRVGVDFLRQHQARITVLNNVATELHAEGAEEMFSTAVGDACNMSHVKDGAFDLVHSNSVIEHVGGWSRMKALASEVRRLAPRYYVQTPYQWFPIDPHRWRFPMIHWLPQSLQAKLMMALPICYAGRLRCLNEAHDHLEHLEMIDRSQFRLLFPDADLHNEMVLGLTKSLVAIR